MNKTEFKDHFSKQAVDYEKYRPRYPQGLFEFLSSITPSHELAWDCATGSGQAAIELAKYFQKVIATDASEKQIANVIPYERVIYEVASSDKTDIKDNSVDIVVVAQALHWFDFDAFYTEVNRVLKARGIIAVWLYDLFKMSPRIDSIVDDFYANVVGDFWPPERLHIENGYKNIPFPFKRIEAPNFKMTTQWSLAHLLGYLRTWSAVQKYKEANGRDPVDLISKELKAAWGDLSGTKKVEWPLTLRAGTVAG